MQARIKSIPARRNSAGDAPPDSRPSRLAMWFVPCDSTLPVQPSPKAVSGGSNISVSSLRAARLARAQHYGLRSRGVKGWAGRVRATHWAPSSTGHRPDRVPTQGAKPAFLASRYAVTYLDAEAKELYERVYCQRREMENRLKEQQLDLFAARALVALFGPRLPGAVEGLPDSLSRPPKDMQGVFDLQAWLPGRAPSVRPRRPHNRVLQPDALGLDFGLGGAGPRADSLVAAAPQDDTHFGRTDAVRGCGKALKQVESPPAFEKRALDPYRRKAEKVANSFAVEHLRATG